MVRVRFAPSPTGPLHIGGLRTALYNYLFAKHHGGTFILRIEDTDRTRYVEGAEAYIIEALQWCGIDPDVGPHTKDKINAGPYRQSERKHLYKKYAEQLVEAGFAYYAFDTPEEIEALRQRLKAQGSKTIHYNYMSREYMKNSLTLPASEVQERIARGDPYVIRIKMPPKETIRFYDEIRGWITVHTSQIDDKILLKSDGMPTYHLANVVDDHLMGITHVIRGEEWLPSTPLHVFMYQAFGWEAPRFAHLPLILRPDGKGKLSKRDGDQMGFPVFPLQWKDPKSGEIIKGYREEGFLPEALINFLVLLGWHPSDNREIFSLDTLIKEFSIERIGKAGVRFNYSKALWFNQYYIRQRPNKDFIPLLRKAIKENQWRDYDDNTLETIIQLLKERVKRTTDFIEEGAFFFTSPKEYDEKTIQKQWKQETQAFLQFLEQTWETLEQWDVENIQNTLQQGLKQWGLKPGKAFPLLRVAITGKGAGPSLPNILAILGKEESLKRLKQFLAYVQSVKQPL